MFCSDRSGLDYRQRGQLRRLKRRRRDNPAGKKMKRELTIAGLMADLARFDPETPCVAHIWMADDFSGIKPALTPDEVRQIIALADASLDTGSSLSWGFMLHCADVVLAGREQGAE